MLQHSFAVGDKVVKNPATYKQSGFDRWGCGEGVGEIIELIDSDSVDVRWPAGTSYHRACELLPAPN